MSDPRWEHGYRCHGYWVDLVRWGFVSIQARRFGRVSRVDGYSWEFFPNGVIPRAARPGHKGTCDTLRQAKRAVERQYREWLARPTETPPC